MVGLFRKPAPKAYTPANDDDDEERRFKIARTCASTDSDEENHDASNKLPAIDAGSKPAAAAENPSNPGAPKCQRCLKPVEDESHSCQVPHPEHLLVKMEGEFDAAETACTLLLVKR